MVQYFLKPASLPAGISNDVRQQTPQSALDSEFWRQSLFHFPGLIQAPPVSVRAVTKPSVENRNLLEKRQLHLHSVCLPRRVLLTKPSEGLPENTLRGGVWGYGGATNFRLMGVWGRGEMKRILELGSNSHFDCLIFQDSPSKLSN